jgi:aryl sulfotransferase
MSDEPRRGIPWIRPEIQQDIAWRDGDIVISVPAKSGTTWTMNIVYQLLNGGTSNFRGVYEEVPWIEFLESPTYTPDDVHARIAAMPRSKPRAFKTHSAPPDVPFLRKGSGKDVKYLVIARNPEEALVSFKPFLEQHSDAWYDLWGVPRAAVTRPDFQAFYDEVVTPGGMQGMFFGFMAAWWPLRHEPNVLFLHYADMKKDHEGSIRKIAKFLGITPPADRWPAILEYTGFPWMKANEHKFEAGSTSAIPPLNPGAMMRKGKLGAATEDGMTAGIAAHLRAVGESICQDKAAVEWLYHGGRTT